MLNNMIGLGNRIKKAFDNDSIKILSVFFLFFSVFSAIYFSIDRFPSLDDPFFHIRFAEILREKGIDAFSNFHWLYFSRISQDQAYFIYYNFLFYLILIPFTFIKPLFLGLKLYGIMFNALGFTILYSFLLKIRERGAFFWIVSLFSVIAYTSIWRLFLARPYTLAPALLLLLIYFIYRKKYLFVVVISILYFFWHTATFFFPLGLSVLYFLFEGFYGRKLDWKIPVSVFLGTFVVYLSTLSFAPGLFSYMKDIIFRVIWEAAIAGNKINIAEGGEVYAVNFIDFIKTNNIIVGLLVVAFVFEIYQYVESKKNGWNLAEKFSDKHILKATLFFLSAGFMLGTLISKRNGDFFVYFSAAYIVMSFNQFIGYFSVDNKFAKKSLIMGLVILVVYLFVANSLFLNDQIASSGPYDGIEGAAKWLEKNTKEGDIVFNGSWNWFPTLFYYNSHNYYVAGIEPRFLYDYDPSMYWVWWNISNKGYVCYEQECAAQDAQKNLDLKRADKKDFWYKEQGDKIAAVIKDTFKSKYVVSSKDLASFNEVMSNNSHFEKVFTDNIYGLYSVYKVN